MKLWTLTAVITAIVLAAFDGHAGTLQADLAITKTDSSATSTPGTPITYTIVVTNNGPNDVTGATVQDIFPAVLANASWTCTASAGSSCTAAGMGNISDMVDVLSGGTLTYTASADIDPAASGDLDNTATVTAPMGVTDSVPANNSASDSNTLVASADLSITKTDNATEHTPGTPVTYTIVAENNGPSAVGDALVTDTFAAPLSNCSWTSVAADGASGNTNASGDLGDTLGLPVGASVTYTATCDVDPAATGTLSNTATINSSAAGDPTPGSNSATDTSALTPSADLSITKTDGATEHAPGTPITYSIVASNSGPSDVTDAVVNDTFSAPLSNCSWTSVAAGGASGNTDGSGDLADTLGLPVGATVTYTATCDVHPAATGTLSNTATIDSNAVGDPTPGNNSATDTSALTPLADLSISKTDNATEHTPGTPVTYSIVAGNSGPSDVTDALVSDTFGAPLSNCSWTSVAAGGASGNTNASGDLGDTLGLPVGATVTYTATCDVDPAASGELSNTATIGSNAAEDPAAGNDSATDTSTLTASADLSITKTDNATEHTPGTPITYTIVAENSGPSAVDDALVTDTFTAPLSNCSWTSVATGGATGNTDGSGNLADTLNMPVGSSVTYIAACDVSSSALGFLSNTATIASSTTTDPNPGAESATDADTLLVAPAVPVPALSLWSILAMLGMLALFGRASLRRRLA